MREWKGETLDAIVPRALPAALPLLGKPLSCARPCLGSFFRAVLWWRVCRKRSEKVLRDRRDLGSGSKEDRLVGLRRLVEAANLSYELQRCRVNLFLRNGRFEVEKSLDVSTHDPLF